MAFPSVAGQIAKSRYRIRDESMQIPLQLLSPTGSLCQAGFTLVMGLSFCEALSACPLPQTEGLLFASAEGIDNKLN